MIERTDEARCWLTGVREQERGDLAEGGSGAVKALEEQEDEFEERVECRVTLRE